MKYKIGSYDFTPAVVPQDIEFIHLLTDPYIGNELWVHYKGTQFQSVIFFVYPLINVLSICTRIFLH